MSSMLVHDGRLTDGTQAHLTDNKYEVNAAKITSAIGPGEAYTFTNSLFRYALFGPEPMLTRIIVHPGLHPVGAAWAKPPALQPAHAAAVRSPVPLPTGAPSAQPSTSINIGAPSAQPSTPLHTAAPSAQPSTSVNVAIAKSPNIATINPAILHFQNPQFRPPLVRPQARTDFDLPTLIAPAAVPTDALVYQAPKDSSKRFFLPGYAIAAAPGGAARAKWVSFEPSGGGYLLTVHLADATPAALSQGNARLDPPTRYLISASLQGRAVKWDLTTVPSPQGVALTLTLIVGNFADRDLLYEAMTDPAAQAVLTIRRAVDIVAPGWRAARPPTRVSRRRSIPYCHSRSARTWMRMYLRVLGAPLPRCRVGARLASTGTADGMFTFSRPASRPRSTSCQTPSGSAGRKISRGGQHWP